MYEVKFFLYWDIINKLIVLNGLNNYIVISVGYSLGIGVLLRYLVFLYNVIFFSGFYISV